MTPFEIGILMHYHCRPGDYRENDGSCPILEPTLERFVQAGLLQRCDGGSSRYRCTDATYVFVNAICAVPAPVQRWVIPGEGEG